MKEDRIYLLHIQDAIRQVLEYTREGRDGFFADRKTQDAVVRNLEIIGEAVKRLSAPFRSQQADIPWKRIAGMRDKVIHDYFGVDFRLVWETVDKELPGLLRRVEELLATDGTP